MLGTNSVKTVLEQHYECENLNLSIESQSGGDIHQSFIVKISSDSDVIKNKVSEKIFLKTNSGFGANVLESEFESLKIISETIPSLYPQVILFDRVDNQGLLLMSYHHLLPVIPSNAVEAGQALARHHKIQNDKFGWQRDNYIGLTPQRNDWNSNWITFFREHRLTPMLSKADDRGLDKELVKRTKQVIEKLDELLSHKVSPSLVHGDLWSGNLGHDEMTQKTVFYDPAPYFGDREVDIAMTQLFGSQPESFYQAYQQEWSLPSDYEKRIPVYNLYHALNHLILFGSAYLSLLENCLVQIEI